MNQTARGKSAVLDSGAADPLRDVGVGNGDCWSAGDCWSGFAGPGSQEAPGTGAPATAGGVPAGG